MPLQTISVKKGASYTLIHRSKPVAKLNPISSSQEGLGKLIELAPKLRFRSKKAY